MWYKVRDVSQPDPLPTELLGVIFNINPPKVRELLLLKLSELIPQALIGRASQRILSGLTPDTTLQRLLKGFELTFILDELYKIYESHNFRIPQREEIHALESVLKENSHPDLELISHFWNREWKQLREQLARLDMDSYSNFIRNILVTKFPDPLYLLVPGKVEIFLGLYIDLQEDITNDVVPLVKTLLEYGETGPIGLLTPRVHDLPPKILRALQKLITKEPTTPENFSAAVDEALAAKLKKKGFLRRLFKRSNDKDSGNGQGPPTR